MTLEEMKKRKKELGNTNEQISELSGVPLGTVQKVLSGVTETPRYETLHALENVLGKKERSFNEAVMVRESVPYCVGKKQGEYTLEDYYALPDEQRVELIDGVFYDMAAPTLLHQLLCKQICWLLDDYIEQKNGKCITFISPVDVQLDCDDKTMVQPDVFVLCDLKKMKRNKVYGAPDFVVEVLSKSTKRKDMYLKLAKYINADVREYWLVEPDKRSVLVYDLQNDELPKIYGFDSKIPVSIFNGECKIDFNIIYERAKVFYEQMEADE